RVKGSTHPSDGEWLTSTRALTDPGTRLEAAKSPAIQPVLSILSGPDDAAAILEAGEQGHSLPRPLPPGTGIDQLATPPDLSLTKGHGGLFYIGSTNATFSFTVSNSPSAGPTTGTITVTDTLPNGITYNSLAFSNPPATPWSCSVSGQTVT